MSESVGYVSLFSGGMGLDLGLEQAGFRTLACNENDRAAVETIRLNRPNTPVLSDCVTTLTREVLEEVVGTSLYGIPLIAGGPPCQAFSVFGRRKGILDERGTLIFEFVRLVEELRPKVFLMENVRGLHSMSLLPKSAATERADLPREKTAKGSLLRKILAEFEELGYRVDAFMVNAVNYGAPQIRERLICIGNRFGKLAEFPQPMYSNRPKDRLPPFRTLGDAIGDGFEDPDPSLMNFSERKLRYLSMVPPGGNWRSMPEEIQKESMGKSWYLKGGRSAYWRRLSHEFPSPTVVTMPNHAGTSMCHPDHVRALTAGECAAIQEFPPEWTFAGTPAEKYRMIGNAVPIRLPRIAGEVVSSLLCDIENGGAEPGEVAPSRVCHIRPHVRRRSYWKEGKALAGNHSYYESVEEPDPKQLDLLDEPARG